ncbi:hypothetical protein Tco_0949602, partial [Tanacetum coccineum]
VEGLEKMEDDYGSGGGGCD